MIYFILCIREERCVKEIALNALGIECVKWNGAKERMSLYKTTSGRNR